MSIFTVKCCIKMRYKFKILAQSYNGKLIKLALCFLCNLTLTRTVAGTIKHYDDGKASLYYKCFISPSLSLSKCCQL
jgi:hypothetical protein